MLTDSKLFENGFIVRIESDQDYSQAQSILFDNHYIWEVDSPNNGLVRWDKNSYILVSPRKKTISDVEESSKEVIGVGRLRELMKDEHLKFTYFIPFRSQSRENQYLSELVQYRLMDGGYENIHMNVNGRPNDHYVTIDTDLKRFQIRFLSNDNVHDYVEFVDPEAFLEKGVEVFDPDPLKGEVAYQSGYSTGVVGVTLNNQVKFNGVEHFLEAVRESIKQQDVRSFDSITILDGALLEKLIELKQEEHDDYLFYSMSA